MPEIRPFQAIHYDFARYNKDISNVIAPPYDVLDRDDKKALLAKDPHNIVAIDLPHIPPKEEGPQQAYLDAQFNLDMWSNTGVLVRDEKPALYLYHQIFEYEGRQLTRRKFIAAVRLHAFEEGVVLPHERTFGGPKADRLALMKETRCNLSPVFGLYTDPEDKVGAAFSKTAGREPDATGKLEGIENRLWVVDDSQVIDTVTSFMADKKIFIADGHHRYTTALNYRDLVANQLGERMSADHPANYVMVVLASMDDPGCVIQGYCRVLVGDGVSVGALKEAWSGGVAEAGAADADLMLYDGASKKSMGLKFTNRPILDKLAPDRHESWRKLDIAYLHTYLIDDLAAKKMAKAPEVRYVKSADMAKSVAEETSGVAVIPKAVPMEQLRAVSEANELMPQKSTYFYPKLATGMTIHSLYEEQ